MEKLRFKILKFMANFLLLIVILQQLVGSIYFNVRYHVKIDREMNSLEAKVALLIKDEYDIDSKVKILSVEDHEYSNILGYGAKFVFTKELEGENITFTFDDNNSTDKIVTVKKSIQPNNNPKSYCSNDAAKDQWSPDFFLGLVELQSEVVIVNKVVDKNFSDKKLTQIAYLLIPSPPPMMHCA